MTSKPKAFGSSVAFGDVNFPKWLTPKVIHSALFVHNAPTKEEIRTRVEYCAKQIGNEAMAFAMALLVLPDLMESAQRSPEYKAWQEMKQKKLN
jgi:hypothetical protein